MSDAAEMTLPATRADASAVARPIRAKSMPAVPSSMMGMLSQAVQAGQPIEVIRELMAMAKELAADEARKAFIAARSAAKAEIPVIRKNKHVGFESKKPGATSTDYWHEDLGEIVATVDPILARHGLSYEFVPEQTGGMLKITCVLSHEGGYSKEYPLSAGNDSSGNKNSIQGVGSTGTYLSRYTLKMALGLAASRDDDGALADQIAGDAITDAQIKELIALKDKVGADVARFCHFFGIEAIPDLPAKRFDEAMKMLSAKASTHA